MATQLQQVLGRLAEERERLSLERTVLRLKQKKLDDMQADFERERRGQRQKLAEAIRMFVEANGEARMDREMGPRSDVFCCQFMFDARFVDQMFQWGNSTDRIEELAEQVSRYLAPKFAKAMLGYNSVRPVVKITGVPIFMQDGPEWGTRR